MIHGHKPSGYFVTADGEGRKIEGETRQCCHCQFMWNYRPGSGDRRGWCMKHNGFLCARPECEANQVQMVHNHLLRTGKEVSCISFEEWNESLADTIGKTSGKLGQDFVVSSGGLIVPA